MKSEIDSDSDSHSDFPSESQSNSQSDSHLVYFPRAPLDLTKVKAFHKTREFLLLETYLLKCSIISIKLKKNFRCISEII